MLQVAGYKLQGARIGSCRPIGSHPLPSVALFLLGELGVFARESSLLHALICGSLLLMPLNVMAGGSRSLVEQGNRKYSEEKYDEALKAYEEAYEKIGEDDAPYLDFNKGAVLYRQGDYAGAKDFFIKAAGNIENTDLEAESFFNLGNCAFRESEAQRKTDLDTALKSCEESLLHYRKALTIDPEMKEAAENIEIARKFKKNVLEEIKKRQEELEKQKQKQKEAADKLQQLAKEQEKLRKENQNQTQNAEEKSQKQKDKQKELKKESEKLAEKMSQPKPAEKSQMDQALQNLKKSIDEQSTALEKMEQQNTTGAARHQERSEKALKDAISALKEKSPDTKKQEKDEKTEPKNENAPNQQEQQEQQLNQEETAAMLNDKAMDILKEEERNREQRRVLIMGGSRPVDKDW